MVTKPKQITAARARDVLDYDSIVGSLSWAKTLSRNVKAGTLTARCKDGVTHHLGTFGEIEEAKAAAYLAGARALFGAFVASAAEDGSVTITANAANSES